MEPATAAGSAAPEYWTGIAGRKSERRQDKEALCRQLRTETGLL